MTNNKPVLVATDLSENADEAIRQGDAVARATGRRFMVCHVLPEMFHINMLFPHLRLQEAFELPRLQAAADEAVTRRVEALTGRSDDDFDVVLENGSPHHGILEQAQALGVGTIVLGAHGTGLAGVLGNVVKRVVRHAPCDVLVARKPVGDGGILSATDFSDASRAAVDRAVAEARSAGRKLGLVYALDFIPPGVSIPTVDVPMPSMAALGPVRQEMQRLLDEESHRVGAEPIFREGAAGPAICTAARDAGAVMVVVGTHGRTGFGRLALGSVAENVVEHAPCSVLVVR